MNGKRGTHLGRTAALGALALVLLASSCSLKPLFDGTYTTVQPKLDFVMLGENIALGAKVYVSSSLEDNTDLMPNGDTYGDYARWAGWWTSALNDGVTTMSLEGQGPLGWSTMTASPKDNIPSWIVYDFGEKKEITAVGLWPRSDTPTGRGSNAPRNYTLQYWDSRSVPTEEDYAADRDAGVWVNITDPIVQPENWPTDLTKETLHDLSALGVETRYFRFWIDEAGGNFVQLIELAVYEPVKD